MILDNNLIFDSAASVAIGVGTQASTNQINLVNARDMGVGDGEGVTPKLMVLVTTAFTTTNAATLQVGVQGSTDNNTYTTYALSDTIAAAQLTAGAQLLNIDMPRPKPGAALPQYLRLLYTVATGTFSTGNLTSALVLTRGDIVNYPPGVAVSN